SLRQPDGFADLGVGAAAVFLQLFDDRFGHLVEGDGAAAGRHALDSLIEGRSRQGNPQSRARIATKSAVPTPPRRGYGGHMAERIMRNFINGEYVEARSDDRFDVIDPATEQSYASSTVSGEADVDAAYAAASAAFETWGESTPAERQLALFRIADKMEERAEEFADLESQDTGKPRASLVDDEIMLSVDQIRFFAGAARNLEGRATAEYMADHTSSIRREPIGVVGQVTPWNYPLNMAVWKFAPAIAAGNTSVLKPSDTTPQSTLLLAEIAAEFLPPGVLNVITGDRTT